jgi:hypothetical protein
MLTAPVTIATFAEDEREGMAELELVRLARLPCSAALARVDQ